MGTHDAVKDVGSPRPTPITLAIYRDLRVGMVVIMVMLAAALVIDQYRSIADVSRELDVVEQTLGNWVRQERIDRGEREGTTTEMREENTRLRREVKRLTQERDLLKRAVAFWVKESDR